MRRKRTTWQRDAIVGDHGVEAVGHQDDDHVVGRLFERLEQRVGRLLVEEVGVGHDVDLVPSVDGREAHVVGQLADLVDDVAGGTRRLDEVNVRVAAATHAVALGARAATVVVAEKRARQGASRRGLAGARRPHEQVGVADVVAVGRPRAGSSRRAPGRRCRPRRSASSRAAQPRRECGQILQRVGDAIRDLLGACR